MELKLFPTTSPSPKSAERTVFEKKKFPLPFPCVENFSVSAETLYDVDADLYLSPRYGRSLRKDPTSNDLPARTDRILWDKARDSPTEILIWLTEDRRTYHRERTNLSRNQKFFNVGDIVFVRVSVQSKASSGRVAKLSYCQRGPYEIVEESSTDS